jgi:uncharacterized protein YbjQ (UPF0145 family)
VSETAPGSVRLPSVDGFDLNEYASVSTWHLWAVGSLVAALILFWIARRIARLRRRARPAVYHPKLQPWAEGAALDEGLAARRRAEAVKILATSSTPRITGYEIVEQIEAVYVEGFRRPEDALEGLKAAAAMKGANALINVRHERGNGGKCASAGDAVIVRKQLRRTETTPEQTQ